MEKSSEQGIEIATGRRAGDARMRLFVFAGELLALAIEGQGERASTLLLTREQAMKLQETLRELLPLLSEPVATEQDFGKARAPRRERRKTSESSERV